MRRALVLAGVAAAAAVGVTVLASRGEPARMPIADYERLVPIVEDFGRAREAIRHEVVTDPIRGGRALRALFPANPAGGWTDLRLAAMDGVPAGAGSLEVWARGSRGARILVTLWEVESRSVGWTTQEMFGFEIELREPWTRYEIQLGEFRPRWTIGGDGRLAPAKVVSVGLAQIDLARPTAVWVDDVAWLPGPARIPERPAANDWSLLDETLARLRELSAVDEVEIPVAVRAQAPCVVRVTGALLDGSQLMAAGVLLDERTVACNKHFIGALRDPAARVEAGGGDRGEGRMLGGLEGRAAEMRAPLASDVAFLDLGAPIEGGRWCRFEAANAPTGGLVYSVVLDGDGEPRFAAGNAVAADGVTLCDLPAEQGQSGSPVFDGEGRMLGIIAGRYRGCAIVIPALEILGQVAAIRASLPALDERNRDFFAREAQPQ